MSIEIGLLSSQQVSFEQHEELSKLLNETDVFYVPLRTELGENTLNTNYDSTDLTKRFDEDISNKHLIVTFRDIGYSLNLDSVESILDENDQSKIRVSGKMIVDGICVQFFGCFDYGHRIKKHSKDQTQQINGVGRVELDEEYYRELSSAQTLLENNVKDEEEKTLITRKTRQQRTKLKERNELINKSKTRSQATSGNIVLKNRSSASTSPPPPSLKVTAPLSYSSKSTSRSHLHSPSHMPYPRRSPRTKQHGTSPPVHSVASSTVNTSVHSSGSSNVPQTFNEYPYMASLATISTTQSSQPHHLQVIPHTPLLSSPAAASTTMPIQIPSPSHTNFAPGSLPQLTNLFPLTQSHSLPAYFLPTANFAYIAPDTSSTNPSSVTPFGITPLTGNTSVLLIANPSQHPTQPVHILTPIDHRSFQVGPYTPASIFVSAAMPPPPPPPPPPIASQTCNILQSTLTNDSTSILLNKRSETEDDKHIEVPLETNQQSIEQLPFKKRRYASQQLRIATVHNDGNDDDGEISDESVKK